MMHQYCHIRNNDGWVHGIEATLVVAVPTKEEIERVFITHSTQTLMCIGLTIKSDNDQYVKKIGRQKAFEKMAVGLVNLGHIELYGTKHIYVFRAKMFHNRTEYDVVFSLSTVAESKKCCLINASIGLWMCDER